MRWRRSLAFVGTALLVLAGCSGDQTPTAPTGAAASQAQVRATAVVSATTFETLTATQAQAYLSLIAPSVAGRVLNATERQLVATRGGAAIEPVVRGWTTESGFVLAAREFMEQSLSVSGVRNGVDFGLPGNLVAHLVRNNRPWSEVLTASTCHDAAGAPIACDTGAPYTAGVLTTRAYMASRASRFNLTRAGTMLKVFACQAYPLADSLEPRIDKARLIPMFQANTREEQTDPRAGAGFGNGTGCYLCHGQFGPHSQLFVKFDSSGRYVAAATGLQDPAGELGRSTNGLMASHYANPSEAASEASQMFGQPVTNLAAAARVMAQRDSLAQCTSRRLLDYSVGASYGVIDYPTGLFADIAARTVSTNPTLAQIALATFTHPTVVNSILGSVTP